ncbi:TonB-dependent receptor [Ruficoccus amylovorans]|uniref:TonB-dependent receptor n=1 Tax=Ruficoccus amylovorans TaxID=1804625 RepID=A0A842HE98_9BACT|nr:TonB-dependent receptor [Ruficoccus amylovorans]MBC2594843.1 TonB-dependent receptor [Ruficoccus amylovorans]
MKLRRNYGFENLKYRKVAAMLSGLLMLAAGCSVTVAQDEDKSSVQADDNWGDFTLEDAGPEKRPASTVPAEEIPEGIGSIGGQVFDTETAGVVEGVTVTLTWPEQEGIEQGTEVARQQTVATDERGVYGIKDVPSGVYSLSFFKSGYKIKEVIDVKVYPDEVTRADAALEVKPVGFSDDIFDFGEFAVEFQSLDSTRDMLEDLKRQSPGTIDFLTSEDFAKFGGSDLASVIQRMPGVTVVEGQFAVVRGLGDRYNSTLLNGLPVPSPDPVRQGMQLDLFPTSMIESVVTQKQFLPNLPSNSSGAAFDLQTKAYAEETTVFFKGGFRFNTNATGTYLKSPSATFNDNLADGANSRPQAPASSTSTVIVNSASKQVVPIETTAPIGLTFSAGASGTFEVNNRKMGLIFSSAYNSDYGTAEGYQQKRYASNSSFIRIPFPPPGRLVGAPGSLYNYELGASDLRYDLTESDAEVLIGILAGVGYELDPEGDNRVDFTFLMSQSGNDFVQSLKNGYLPAGFAGSSNTDRGFGTPGAGTGVDNIIGRGGADTNTVFTDVISYEQRELYTYQLGGRHVLDELDDLKLNWGGTVSSTTSNTPHETVANYLYDNSTDQYFYTDSNFIGDAIPFIQETWRDISEDQYGARMDLEYDWKDKSSDWLSGKFSVGGFWAQASRSVDQVDTDIDLKTTVSGNTKQDVVDKVLNASTANGAARYSWAETSRDIGAGYLMAQFNLTENVQITGGARFGNLRLNSNGYSELNALTTLTTLLAQSLKTNPNIYNGDLLGFDTTPTGGLTRDQVIAQQLAEGGRINQNFALPAATVNVDVTEQVSFMAGYSQTLAQPSFRELSPYFSRELGTGDIVVGNPLLQTSEVESFDLGVEYRPWEGAIIGVGAFYKTVENPIEQIAIYDKNTNTTVMTYFNNPNTARLKGIEFQFGTDFAFVADELEYFSFGMNFAYIDAKVAFPDEVRMTYINTINGNSPNAGTTDGQTITLRNMPNDRRLFDQPEYIVNANVTYNNPDWGTAVTLSIFAQSDVLTTVGSGADLSIDQYSAPFYTLDLTISQNITDNLQFQFSVSNLTDTSRSIIYSQEMTNETIYGESVKIGQTFKFALEYTF